MSTFAELVENLLFDTKIKDPKPLAELKALLLTRKRDEYLRVGDCFKYLRKDSTSWEYDKVYRITSIRIVPDSSQRVYGTEVIIGGWASNSLSNLCRTGDITAKYSETWEFVSGMSNAGLKVRKPRCDWF